MYTWVAPSSPSTRTEDSTIPISYPTPKNNPPNPNGLLCSGQRRLRGTRAPPPRGPLPTFTLAVQRAQTQSALWFTSRFCGYPGWGRHQKKLTHSPSHLSYHRLLNFQLLDLDVPRSREAACASLESRSNRPASPSCYSSSFSRSVRERKPRRLPRHPAQTTSSCCRSRRSTPAPRTPSASAEGCSAMPPPRSRKKNICWRFR